jgi:hypothetical protein
MHSSVAKEKDDRRNEDAMISRLKAAVVFGAFDDDERDLLPA